MDFSLKAQISSDSRYRLETSYQNNYDILVFDGTNTLVYRGVNNPDGSLLGADVVVLSNHFPEHLAGYIQAAWMATYLNWALSQNISTNVLASVIKTKYLQNLLGPDMIPQMVVKSKEDSDSFLVRAYLPGNAVKNGNPVFTSPSYKAGGLLFEQISFSQRDSAFSIYTTMELTGFTPYREPVSPEDVLPVHRHHITLHRIIQVRTLVEDLPALTGLLGVTDFSTAAQTNLFSPLGYGIRQWSEIRSAQERARDAAMMTGAATSRWLGLVVLCAALLPLLVKNLLVLRPARTEQSSVADSNKKAHT